MTILNILSLILIIAFLYYVYSVVKAFVCFAIRVILLPFYSLYALFLGLVKLAITLKLIDARVFEKFQKKGQQAFGVEERVFDLGDYFGILTKVDKRVAHEYFQKRRNL